MGKRIKLTFKSRLLLVFDRIFRTIYLYVNNWIFNNMDYIDEEDDKNGYYENREMLFNKKGINTREL